MTRRQLHNRISGCKTQLKRHGIDSPRRAELEAYLETLLDQLAADRAPADPLAARIADLEASLEPYISELYRYLRQASPTRATRDRRPTREWNHEVATPGRKARVWMGSAGAYIIDNSDRPLIRTRSAADARAHDRGRAELILWNTTRKATDARLQAIHARMVELDDLRAEAARRLDEHPIFGTAAAA